MLTTADGKSLDRPGDRRREIKGLALDIAGKGASPAGTRRKPQPGEQGQSGNDQDGKDEPLAFHASPRGTRPSRTVSAC